MFKRKYKLLSAIALLFSLCGSLKAQNVPDEYKQYFVKFTDTRSVMEKVLNAVGMSNKDVGRSFALICGISDYSNMSALQKTLDPAAEDVRKLENYLKKNEFFDEIVVLENSEVTGENLKYFLQIYFSDRLKKFPNSRFLFAYSGHGMTDNSKGYLLTSAARNLRDKKNTININVLKDYVDEVVLAGHQVLVLLNSCYGGAFLRRKFGDKKIIPSHPGAHAITAGGSAELTWHDSKVGSGSVFYEKILAGLRGIADTQQDGIVTAHELAVYLREEIRVVSDDQQHPEFSDISRDGSQGEFFFLMKDAEKSVREESRTNQSSAVSMGSVEAEQFISVLKDGVNYRSGPGTTYEILFRLPAGYPLRVIKQERDWILVDDYENDKGWIHKNFVSNVPYAIVKVKEGHVRAGPGSNYDKVGLVVRDVILKKKVQKEGWLKVSHPELTGWIYKDLVWP